MVKKKRGTYGEGTVYYNDKMKKYVAQEWVEFKDGTKRKVSGSGDSKSSAIRRKKDNIKKAKERHKNKASEHKEEIEEKSENIGTLSYAVNSYINSKSNIHKSSNVYYRNYYNGYIKDSTIGNEKMQDITETMLLDYYDWLSRYGNKRSKGTKGLSISTINHIRQIISSTFKKAYDDGLIAKNVHKSISKFRKGGNMDKNINYKGESIKKKILEKDDINKLVKYGYGNRFYYLFLLDLLWGCRRGEMIALKWDAIDKEKRIVHIRETIAKVEDTTGITGNKYMYIAKEPKSRASNRVIPLEDKALKLLDLQAQRIALEKEMYKDIYKDNGLVFPNEFGGYESGDRITDNFKSVIKEAGIKDHVFHNLRHTFCSVLINNGESAKVVAELMGHSTVITTLDTYTELFNEADVKAITNVSKSILE